MTSIKQLVADIRRRRTSPTELVEQSLAAIEREQPRLNAFITVMAESARASARRLEGIRAGRGTQAGLLTGIPLAVKDLLLTKDALTTAGSRTFGEGLRSERDADVVARLRRAGAIVVGKANLHEVALGVTNVNEHFGPARNPWDSARVSGGSSGGSAVAVAADLCPAAIGTDTRGSIRIPASCCGITGFKPTYGLVPVRGCVPLAFSLDHIGPMARSVEDVALLLAAMLPAGAARERVLRAPGVTSKRLTVGISEYHLRDMADGVGRVIAAALRALRPLVKSVREVRIPGLEGVQEASAVIASTEAVAFHDERLRAHPEGFGAVLRGRLEGGYQRSGIEYVRALQKRAEVEEAFAATFREVDLLVGATLPGVPARIDEPLFMTAGQGQENTVDASTRFNAPQNVAGLPALSVPCGFDAGLPVGLQIFGPTGGDPAVLALGGAWQRATDWHERRPATGRRNST